MTRTAEVLSPASPRSAPRHRAGTELVWLSEEPGLRGAALALLEEYMRSEEAWSEQHGVPTELPVALQQELAAFPAPARPPSGDVLLGCIDGSVEAMGEVVPVDDISCELRRLYVRESARGRSFGPGMVRTMLGAAGGMGYRRALITVIPSHVRVVRSCRILGFRVTRPYQRYEFPMVFMEADLPRP